MPHASMPGDSSEHHVLFGNLVEYDPALLEYAAHPKLVPLVEEVVGGAQYALRKPRRSLTAVIQRHRTGRTPQTPL